MAQFRIPCGSRPRAIYFQNISLKATRELQIDRRTLPTSWSLPPRSWRSKPLPPCLGVQPRGPGLPTSSNLQGCLFLGSLQASVSQGVPVCGMCGGFSREIKIRPCLGFTEFCVAKQSRACAGRQRSFLKEGQLGWHEISRRACRRIGLKAHPFKAPLDCGLPRESTSDLAHRQTSSNFSLLEPMNE